MEAQTAVVTPPAPVRVEVRYPERLSRWHLLLKSFFGWLYVGIPHGIVLYVLGILAGVATLVAFLAILFIGEYPRGLFDFVVRVRQWSLRVLAYGTYYMTDRYPPFAMVAPDYPATLEIAYPERLSRGHALLKLLLGWLYVGIPHGIALLLYSVAALVALIIAWFAILFTGRFPRGMFDFIAGLLRWQERVNAYLSFMRDEYPPFSGRP